MKRLLMILQFVWLMMISLFANGLTLPELQHRFSQHPVVRAEFVQTRYIDGLSEPLRSSGQMIFSKTLGLWWEQQTPFIMVMKINQTRMEQLIQGQKPQIITVESQPQLFQFNYLLTAIFNAQQSVLKENFTLSLTNYHDEWQLVLIPKLTPLNKIFKQIIVSGQAYLSKIEIDDMQLDRTVIIFTNHQTYPLSENEQQRFK